ncbi:hypothetical protein [Mesorhizobium sp.]|uniref:hypothetical protein n=1 Tax=Mesorhizobium sp. TaxID=1871066 RepID=UPI0025EA22E9|nr:hypothetical protein [Mesorhizobium sp.]
MDAYAAMVPEVDTSWPGAGIGFAASVDQVRKLTFPVVFGQVSLQPWQLAGFSGAEEWWNWCRQDRAIAGEVAHAVSDLHDLTNGFNEVEQKNPAAVTLWRMARSNLEDVANTLPTTFSHDSVIQPICMVAELSMKAALVWDGVDPDSFRKGKDGHNLSSLARRMANARQHRDDLRVQAVVDALPPYVESRYKPAGLKRLQVVKLALGVQFIAASSLRRIASDDLALPRDLHRELFAPFAPSDHAEYAGSYRGTSGTVLVDRRISAQSQLEPGRDYEFCPPGEVAPRMATLLKNSRDLLETPTQTVSKG